jgi:DNA replication protein DnaC
MGPLWHPHSLPPTLGALAPSGAAIMMMEERYRQHSTIITTNLVYDEWPNFLGSRPMVEALLSRLRHYCHTVHIDGPSLRVPQG